MLHEKPSAALLPDAWERIFGCGSKSGALRFTGFLRISSKNNPLYVYSVWIVKIKCTIDKYVWWLHGILWVLVLRYAHMCTGQSEHAVTANSLRSQQRHEQKGLNDVWWLSDFRCANCQSMACCKSSKSKLRLFEWDIYETVMQDVNPFKNTAPATMFFFKMRRLVGSSWA